jgi:hypothetical protein
MAGWQRGGFLAERVLWIALGVVLVVAAHLLPAVVRSLAWRVRAVGTLLWIRCIAATCYGHAVFFLIAQKYAGELRAAAVPVVTAHGRARAYAPSAGHSLCASMRSTWSKPKHAAAECAAALADPVTGALTAYGQPAARVNLSAGLNFAGVLEAVACFAWLRELGPAVVAANGVTPATQGHTTAVTAVTTESNAAE